MERTITKRMATAFDGLQKDFSSPYTQRDFDIKIGQLHKSQYRSDRPSILKNLFDMFDSCGIEYEKGKDDKYYADLVKKSNFPTISEISDRMIADIFSMYVSYPSPENYMKRIVDDLCCNKDGWQNDTLRLRILKQFIKYTNCLARAGIGGREIIREYVAKKLGVQKIEKNDTDIMVANVEDDIFDYLNTISDRQNKDAKKNLKTKLELLKISDELASGTFRTGGSTKKYLYLFAMAFNMKYYLIGSDVPDPKRDFEKRLFTEYYANNIIRFATAAYKGEQLNEFEIDVSGQGINYKNFAEVIYLYYLANDNLSPQDKIEKSHKMISDIKNINPISVNIQDKGGTKAYRNLFGKDTFDAAKFSLEEEEFKKYISEKYNCNTKVGKNTVVAPIRLENEQNSAFQQYNEIIEELVRVLNEQSPKIKEKDDLLSRCNYGLWFVDVAFYEKTGLENARKELFDRISNNLPPDKKEICTEESVDDFIAVLRELNNMIGNTVDESQPVLGSEKQEHREVSVKRTKNLFIDSPSKITRTGIIVAYYYWYNAQGYDREVKFDDFFADFASELNERLKASYYQPLSSRNIIDVLVAFSAYAYLNDNW